MNNFFLINYSSFSGEATPSLSLQIGPASFFILGWFWVGPWILFYKSWVGILE
jgi:hypothetical protein